MIFTFTKMQSSLKRAGMIDIIYFEGTLSVRKGAPERFHPLTRENINMYEYLEKCSEKDLSKGKYRRGNNEVDKQTTTLTLVLSFN